MREEVKIKFGNSLFDTFFDLYQKTMTRNGLFLEPKNAVKELITSNNDNICAVAYYKGKALVCALVPNTTYGAYYFLGESAKIVGNPKKIGSNLFLKYPEANKYYYLNESNY